MNLKQIEKRLPQVAAAIEDNKHAAIQAAIDMGEMLAEAKGIKKGDFQDWLKEQKAAGIKYIQATKYMRIAAHKWEALEHADKNVDELQTVLPKVKAPPRRTEADAKKLGYVGTQPTPKGIAPTTPASDMWNTPTIYIESARAVLGGIDLDPFTSPAANARVKAGCILTETDNGFNPESWPECNTVWMNPPYSRGAAQQAVDALLENLSTHLVKEAVVLMNASTDSGWFHDLLSSCHALCLTKGRIAFLGPDGTPSKGNTKGQVFFYFGPDVDAFYEHFSPYGAVLPGAFEDE